MPYHVRDDELTDEWQCNSNAWDPAHSHCSVPQALSNEEIDTILALQDGAGQGMGEEGQAWAEEGEFYEG